MARQKIRKLFAGQKKSHGHKTDEGGASQQETVQNRKRTMYSYAFKE